MKRLISLTMIFSLLGLNTAYGAGINNSANKTGCTYARTHIKNTASQDFVKGLATMDEVFKESTYNATMFTKIASYTNGSIKTNMMNMANAFKLMKMGIYQNDVNKMAASAILQKKYITTLDKLCKSIGK